jgi:hypothetical protein
LSGGDSADQRCQCALASVLTEERISMTEHRKPSAKDKDTFMAAFKAWDQTGFGDPEPLILLDTGGGHRPISASEACSLVWDCDEPFPISQHAIWNGWTNPTPAEKRTYGEAAMIMLGSIKFCGQVH